MVSGVDDDGTSLRHLLHGAEHLLRAAHLRVVLGCLHAQDVRDDAVDLHITDQSSKEKFLHDGRTEQPQSRQSQQ